MDIDELYDLINDDWYNLYKPLRTTDVFYRNGICIPNKSNQNPTPKPTCQIIYTTTDDKPIQLSSEINWGANIISNVYE